MVKWLQSFYRKGQNKGVHKNHVLALRQVNLKELEFLQFICLTDFEKVVFII